MFRRTMIIGSFLVTSLFLVTVLANSSTAFAAKKKHGSAKKEVITGPSEREKKLLGWTSVYPTAYTFTRADFFIRGAIADFKQDPQSKQWDVSILPIEVINNPMHYITLDHYKNGITLRLDLNSYEVKALKKGVVVEYNQYSKEIPSQQTGHAQLISSENYTEFKPYNISPVAFLNKPGMEPEQVVNVLKGVFLYSGKVEKDEVLKSSLVNLSSNSNSTVSEEAKIVSDKLFGGH
jgi:hypothetical protein